MCNTLAQVAIQNQNSRLAFLALGFIAKWIAAGEKGSPPIYRSADEGLLVSALNTAARTYDSTLLDASWAILRKSLRGRKHPEPDAYLAKIRAQSLLGNLQGAFSTLSELERVHANSASIDEEALFSPFTSLHPLVVACSKKGFETLDSVCLAFAPCSPVVWLIFGGFMLLRTCHFLGYSCSRCEILVRMFSSVKVVT